MAAQAGFPELWFYERMDRVPGPKSFVGKLLAICFVGTHIPLIAFIAFAIAALDLSASETRTAALVLLVATLFGTVTALFAIHAMMAPLNVARVALLNYREHGEKPRLPLVHRDAAGVLMREVDATIARLDTALSDLAREARMDPLTGVGNRRALMEEGRRMVDEAGRTGGALTVAILDLDGFKGVNDRYGHSAGDRVLAATAAAMRTEVTPDGFVGRLGGDEFCILLPRRPLTEAMAVLERVRAAVTRSNLDPVSPGEVATSIGVSELHRPQEDTLPQLLSRADAQVYRAKAQGRNRICGPGTDAAADAKGSHA